MSGPPLALIVGATSDIARAVALRWAAMGWSLILAGRDMALLERDAEDLRLRHGVSVATRRIDALDTASFPTFVAGLPGLPDVVVCLVGALEDQRRAEADGAVAERMMRGNFIGPALLLGEIAHRMAARGSGVVIGVSSVAGDRGRAANYVYGSAKAGFSAFLSGLRARMSRCGVRVVTIKPGFVRTRMTEGMTLPRFLTAEADEVARVIADAPTRGREVVYAPGIWRLVMFVIRALPETLFKRLRL